MSAENIQDNYLQTVLISLTKNETSIANEVYILAEKLEKTLDKSTDINAAWFESINSLDLRIEDTLSRAVQNEMKAIGSIENILVQHRNPDGYYQDTSYKSENST